MASSQDMSSFKIDKLTSENYHSWKFNVKMFLMAKDLWGMANGTEVLGDGATADARAKFTKRDNLALATICLSVSSSLQIYVRSCETSVDAWKSLGKRFEEKTLSKRILYRRKLYGARMAKGTDVVTHLNYMKTIAEHLEAVEDPVSDKDLVMILISSLPDDYDNLITTLEALDENDAKLTWDYVRDRLITECERKKGGSSGVRSNREQDALYTGGGKGRFNKKNFKSKDKDSSNKKTYQTYKCHHCHEPGHFVRDCPKKKSEEAGLTSAKSGKQNAGEDLEVEFALQVSCDDEKKHWWLDSGCSQHMSPGKSDFSTYHKFNSPLRVNLADESHVFAEGSGDVNIQLFDGSSIITVLFKDVLYVPKLQKKLLSITSMTDKGASVKFEGNSCMLYMNDKSISFGHKHGKLWRLNCVEAQCNYGCSADKSLKLWHLRLGHLNFNDVKLLEKGDMVNGLSLDTSEVVEGICEGCIVGKQTRDSFPKKSNRTSTKTLELLHSDVCGPMKVNSIGGSVYFLTIIDDFSRNVFVYMLKHKSEALKTFQQFQAWAENFTGNKIKTLRTDNGGEYISKEFEDFLKLCGIHKENTIPYTPQQNGVAERMNRTLMNAARSMLYHAGLNIEFWAEAVSTAAYLRNRSPTSSFKGSTPYERFYSEKPDVTNLRVFGCHVFVHVPREKCHKLDKRSMKCIFVGYPDGSKGYKVYNPETKKMLRTRDVIFVENSFDSNSEYQKEVLDFDVWSDDSQMDNVTNDLNQPSLDEVELPDPVHIIDGNVVHDEQNQDVVAFELPEHVDILNDNVDEQVLNQDHDVFERPHRNRREPERFGEWEYAAVAIGGCVDPASFKEAMQRDDSQQWKIATDSEIKSLQKNSTWELVDLPPGKTIIGSRWVMKTKCNADGSISKYKARLVAQGFSQKHGIDYDEVFAPVVKYSSLRALLALANQHNFEIHQMDVKSAYLYGEVDNELYMRQPEGYIDPKHPTKVCRLKKSLYGLKQSARCWNVVIDTYLKSEQYKQSGADPCIYTKNVDVNGKKIFTVIALYVDDTVIVCNDSEFLNAEKIKLKTRFEMEDLGEINYLLGMTITRDRKAKTLTIDQKLYLKSILERFGMSQCKPVATPLEPGKRFEKLADNEVPVNVREYQAVIGSLIYASIATRPDLSAAVGVLSQHMSRPSSEHWSAVKRVLRYVKGTLDFGLLYKHSDCFELQGYSDADWGGDVNTRKSTSGYIFGTAGCSISWRSTKQSVVALSTTEAEYIALCQATQEAVWLRLLFKSIGFNQSKPTVVYEDNQSTIAFARSSKVHPRMKHVDIKLHYVREVVNSKVIDLRYCPTTEMVGDVFTKGLAKPTFEKLRKCMGVVRVTK